MTTISWPRRLAAWAPMAFAAAVLWVFTMPSFRQGQRSIAGTKAEDFAVQVAGKPAWLSDFRGKLVVLNLWASYCASCVEEIPDLDRLQQRIRSSGRCRSGSERRRKLRQLRHLPAKNTRWPSKPSASPLTRKSCSITAA
jgi:thiol-disulfide isomerase/thioredoxin